MVFTTIWDFVIKICTYMSEVVVIYFSTLIRVGLSKGIGWANEEVIPNEVHYHVCVLTLILQVLPVSILQKTTYSRVKVRANKGAETGKNFSPLKLSPHTSHRHQEEPKTTIIVLMTTTTA